MKKILGALLSLASFAVFAAPAANSVYVNGAVGATTTYNTSTGANNGSQVQSTGGYDLSGNFGVNLNRNLALEVGYTNIWDASGSNQWGVTDFAVRGTVPLGEVFDLYGRLGVAGYNNTPNGSMSVNTLGVLYGMGAEWNLSRQWALTAEYWGVTGSTVLSNGNVQGGVKFSF